MDKVLLLTNFDSWYLGIPSKIRKRVSWDEETYPNKNNPIVLCVTTKGSGATLQPVGDLSSEGVYLVFDGINRAKLDAMLDACEQNHDRVFILYHSSGYYNHPSAFSPWKQLFPKKGMHEEGKQNLYEPAFDKLTDSEGDKLYRIIDAVFMPSYEAVLDLLQECLVPNKNLEQLPCYQTLSEEGFAETLEVFRKKYESSKNLCEYKEDLAGLRDLLTRGREK